MSMFGEITFFVSLKIQHLKDGIYITQSKYIKEILKKFGMEDSRPIGTPMSTGHNLSKNDDSNEVYQTAYRSMIDKLQYVVHTRLDIALEISIVARFSVNPKENHLMAIKWILRYLKGTEHYGLSYKKEDNFELKAFTDANWVGSIDYRKSTSGGALFLGKRSVFWTSKKQNCIS